MTYYTAEWIDTGAKRLGDHYLEVYQGRIVTIAPLKELAPRAFRDMIAFEDAIITPGLVNGAVNASVWRHQPMLTEASKGFDSQGDSSPEASIFASALACYAEQARQGVTSVVDWSLADDATLHTSASFNADHFSRTARALIRAARQVGLRLTLAVSVQTGDDMQAVTRSLESLDTLCQVFEKTPVAMPEPAILWVLPVNHESDWSGWQVLLVSGALRATSATETSILWWLADQDVLPKDLATLSAAFTHPQTVAAQSPGWLAHVTLPEGWRRLITQDELLKTSATSMPSQEVLLGSGWQPSPFRFSLTETLKLASAQGLIPSSLRFDPVTQVAGRALNQSIGSLQPGAFADFVVMDLEHTSLMPRLSMEHPSNAQFDLTGWLLRAWDTAALRTVMVGGQKVYHQGAWTHVRESQLASWLAESEGLGSGVVQAESIPSSFGSSSAARTASSRL